METNIVKIGNSQGVRIPKALLSQTKLGSKVKLEVRKDTIVISPSEVTPARSELLMSETVLQDWNDPSEDVAWAHLQ